MKDPNQDPSVNAPESKHSTLGIASTVIAILAFLLICVILVASTLYGAADPTAIDTMPEDDPLLALVGILLLCGGGLNLLGIGLGAGGLFQAERTKTFSIIGLILNSLVICGLIVLIILGSVIPV